MDCQLCGCLEGFSGLHHTLATYASNSLDDLTPAGVPDTVLFFICSSVWVCWEEGCEEGRESVKAGAPDWALATQLDRQVAAPRAGGIRIYQAGRQHERQHRRWRGPCHGQPPGVAACWHHLPVLAEVLVLQRGLMQLHNAPSCQQTLLLLRSKLLEDLDGGSHRSMPRKLKEQG